MPKHIQDLIQTRLTRRSVLSGASATALLGPTRLSAAPISDAFEEVKSGMDGHVHWPATTHECDLVIGWGDPIHKDGPEWEKGQTTAEAQAVQFGDSCDFIAYSPLPKGSGACDHGLLTVNHEFTRAATMFVGHDDPKDPARVAAELAGHGMSVVAVKRTESGWAPDLSNPLNRRITMSTPFEVVGPARGHARMKTPQDPDGAVVLGTLANCAGGFTPWGTVLSGEENIHVHWTGPGAPDHPEAASRAAMKIGRRQVWHFSVIDDRFDLGVAPMEPNRFGWVVEVDPYDPDARPKKLTSLGRFFHEGAEVVVDPSGHVVVYMGDDTADEHLYRFVSTNKVGDDDALNRELLADGTLYVAHFDAGGLTWLPLTHEGKLAEEFDSLADILIDTRLAAKVVGATPMDRPERVAVHPKTGNVYVMLTKNPARKVAEGPNARTENIWGQILEILPGDGGHVAARMDWSVLLEGGPPSVAKVAPPHPSTTANGHFACPDNCAFDQEGRLWVTTDGNHTATAVGEGGGVADGLYIVDTDGPHRGRSRLFFRACVGAELTGPCFTPDNSTLFLAVQHPGRTEGGQEGTSWPAAPGTDVPPRSSVVALTRKGGGALL